LNETPSPPTKRRIAVIDDDAVFVDLMRDLLAYGGGYDVVSTAHWLQSFEFIRATRPDLIILDLMLGRGGQTGWRVLEVLREDPSTARIPVILCSAAVASLPGVVVSPNGHGAVEAIAKPFDLDHMLQVIARLLS
jgi:CheY-like chemotaxis protein